MTSIFTQYDPEWEAYKASMGPGPIQTAQEKADQEKLNASLQNLYSQSLSSRNYLTPDQFNAMFPGVKKWGQEQSDWQKQLEEGFTKKYGHSPILGTTTSGPKITQPTPTNQLGNHPVYNPDGSVRGWEPINPNPKQDKFTDSNGIRTFYKDDGSIIGSSQIDEQGNIIVHPNALTAFPGTIDWRNTPGTLAPTPHTRAWNEGDVWDMNRTPQDVVDSMNKYAETHDEKYYQSQIPTPAGSGLVAPPDVASGNPNAKLVGPGTGSTSTWYDASGVQHPITGQAIGKSQVTGGFYPSYDQAAGSFLTTPVTTAPVTTAPVIPPASINPTTTSAVTPPATSPFSTNMLVTQPGATAAQNTIASLQNLLGRAAVGGVGSFKMPDFFKQTQQKWGGFSPAAFSKR